MTLTFCWDLAAADWIARSELPWERLVTFGPAGFDAYARLRFLPDPTGPGQQEGDADADLGWRSDPLPALFDVLAAHTDAPDDCHFCVWDGFGTAEPALDDVACRHSQLDDAWRADAEPGWAPLPQRAGPGLPKVEVPSADVSHRAYWLFRGPLAAAGDWDAAERLPGSVALAEAEPAFVWPADHAWCVALDVDPHWAGIGGSTSLIAQLTADPRLDVVPADPAAEQPHYG